MSTPISSSRTPPSFRVLLEAERPVAITSPDHRLPWGTRRDNSRNPRFNDKLYRLYPRFNQTLKVLDMGCSGGGFVKSLFDEGCLSVGLEGSDYSHKFGRAEWRTIPEYLFTCDITGNFDLFVQTDGSPQRLYFDIVTSWEVMEHIAESDLPRVAANVKKHLAPGALWIMSVSPNAEVINGVVLHQTVRPRPWWIARFAEFGLEHREEYVRYFNTQFVRGPKYNGPGSFHLVLTADPANLPAVPQERLIRRLHDRWIGCVLQKVLAGTY